MNEEIDEINPGELLYSGFSLLPVGSVKPKGWLYNQLRIQADGLTGHLDEFWESVCENSGWLGGSGENWERGPYYCDGLIPLAYILQDEILIAKAKRWIDWILNSQREDGFFGPSNNDDWWPRMVMLKALISYFEATGDESVLHFMSRYFRFQYKHLKEKPLFSWGMARGGENIYVIHWLYKITGEAFLLELADIISQQTIDWTAYLSKLPYTMPTSYYYPPHIDKKLNWNELQEYTNFHAHHIVNVTMGIKTPALLYAQTKKAKHRDAIYEGIKELVRHHGMPTGIFSGDEHLNGNNPTQGSELCSVVEYMFSLETLFDVLGDVYIADILEKVAYNALTATMSKDMWAHQYDQQANQVLVNIAKRNWYNNADDSSIFGLEPNFGCCTANLHQGWPKFIRSLWASTEDDGLAAVIYGPCSVDAVVNGGCKIHIDEETNYPFDEIITLKLNCPQTVHFSLKLRIPGWCSSATVAVNGDKYEGVSKGEFFIIDRCWQNNDVVILTLPMDIRISNWYNNSISIERGSLVYALKIGEVWKQIRGEAPHNDWEVYPSTPWNYALEVDKRNPVSSFEVIKNKVEYQPFDSLKPPIIIKCKGRRLNNWQLENNCAGELPVSPVTSEEPLEEIELIPYGAAKLRVTEIPFIQTGEQ